jgi:hypothetical protein
LWRYTKGRQSRPFLFPIVIATWRDENERCSDRQCEQEVQYAKDKIANDSPTTRGADADERQAADNERHEHGVDQENDVGGPAHVAG